MKKQSLITIFATLILSISTVHAKGASENASAASKHSVLAGSHALKSSGQVVSGVVAVPLLVVGSIGEASREIGSGLIDVATDNNDEALEISDKIITADRSPAEVMKIKQNKVQQI